MKNLFCTLVIFIFSVQLLCAQPTFSLPTVSAQPGQTVCLSVKVADFTDLQVVRFSLNWDSTIVKYFDISNINAQVPNLDLTNFVTTTVNSGKLGFNWKNTPSGCNGNTGFTLGDDEVLFDICLEVIGDVGESSLVEIANSPLATYVARLNSNCIDIEAFMTNGSISIFPPLFTEISGLKNACPGSILSYNVQPLDTCVTDYNWTINPPIGNIMGNSNSDSITIEWTSPGIAQLCVEGIDTCGLSLSVCETIEVNAIVPVDEYVNICIGGTVICGDQVFSTPGVFPVTLQSYLGCDSLVNCIISPIPPVTTNLGEVMICENNPLIVCDSAYYEAGIHAHTCQSIQGCDSTIIFDLIILDSIGIQSITPDTTLCGGGDIQLNVDAPGAVSYNWFPQSNLSCFDCPNPIATVGFSQEFYVVVTNADGCTDEGSVFVDVHFGLDWGLLPFSNSPVCEGDTLELFEELNFNIVEYEWSGPNGFTTNIAHPIIPNIDLNQGGNYQATFTDEFGCEGSTDIFVEILECFQFINLATLPVTCVGSDDGSIHFEIINGSGDYTISWLGPISNIPPVNDLNNLPVGTYYLTVTDNILGGTKHETFVIDLSPNATIADAGDDVILPCNGGVVTMLDGSGSSSGADIEYFWEVISGTPGLSITEREKMNPTVSGTGCFKLTVTNTSTGCTAEDVTCTTVPPPVLFELEANPPFACGNNPIQIDTFNTSLPFSNNFIFEWEIVGTGEFLNHSDTTLTPMVSGSAYYNLTVTDTVSGCLGTQSLFIDELTADIYTGPIELTCDGVFINANNSSSGENIVYNWDGPCILSDPTQLEIQIDGCLGTYYFTVTDTVLECSVIDSLVIDVIVVNSDIPVAEIISPNVITCVDPSVVLDGSNSSTGFDIIYEWIGPDGGIIGNDISVTVSLVGTYTLTVTNISNGCSNQDFVTVESQVNLPNADAGPDMHLDCNNSQVILDGSGSFVGPDIIYSWTTLGGNILSGNMTLTPLVDSAGLYVLTVLNTVDGCENTDTVIVTADFEAIPFAIDDQFLCQGDTLYFDLSFLNAEAYAWSPNINIDDTTSAIVAIYPEQNMVYNATATFANGCESSVFFNTFFEIDCPWPGDGDTSAHASNADILMIGLAFGELGPQRPDTTINWEKKFAFDWTQTTPQSGINFKHIDMDGNGIINAKDTAAIIQNWGLVHNFVSSDDRNDEVPFYVEPDTLFPEKKYALPIILGVEDFVAENVYGVSFSINYDPEIVEEGSANITFNDSWLGEHDLDMISIQKDNHAEGRIDIGLTRIDAQNMTGFGQLGIMHITIEDIIFFNGNDDRSVDETYFEIDNVKIISFEEETLEVNTNPVPAMISNNENAFLDLKVEVFPNPTKGNVYIKSEEIKLEKIEIYSIDGILLKSDQLMGNQEVLNLSDFENGIYVLKVQTENGLLIKRIILM